MRFAIAGLWHETNTFSSVPADLTAFESEAYLHGGEIIEEYATSESTIAGFLEAGQAGAFEAVPLTHARTGPIGLITATAFDTIASRIISGLREHGPWDGVLLANHGAAVSERFPDVDTEIARRVREAIGPDCPIGMALDLHANIGPGLLDYTNIITVYQTNPHLDAKDRGAQCAELLIRTVRGEIQPVQWLETPPLVINITRQATSHFPMNEIIETARAAATRPGIVSTSAVQGYPYADVAEMGMSFLAIANSERQVARETAQAMAGHAWSLREHMQNDTPGPEQALSRAAQSGARPVVIMDAGDNILGGSSADSTVLLHAARRLGIGGILQSLYDPGAVRICDQAGCGAKVSIEVGGKTDQLHGSPISVEATVVSLTDGEYEDPGPTHGGFRYFDDGRRAVIETTDGFTLLLTSMRSSNISRQQMTTAGIDPTSFPIVVAKGVVSPRPAYEPIAAEIIVANTVGLTSANLCSFDYRQRRQPLYPFEPQAAYEV